MITDSILLAFEHLSIDSPDQVLTDSTLRSDQALTLAASDNGSITSTRITLDSQSFIDSTWNAGDRLSLQADTLSCTSSD